MRPLTLREGGGVGVLCLFWVDVPSSEAPACAGMTWVCGNDVGFAMVSRGGGKSCGEVELLADVVGEGFAVDEGGAGDVLDGEADGFEEGDFGV